MQASNQPPTLAEVVGEVGAPLLRFLERYTGNRAVAEDLRQETLLRLEKGLAAFAGRSSLKTWAFAIASRVAADHFRAPERRAKLVDLDEAMDLVVPDRALEERLIEDEMSTCVRQVIDTLPDTYRAALILHDLEELSAAEIAEICDCSLATAKIRIHRARQRLKAALDRQCDFYKGGDGVLRCDRKGKAAPG